MIASRTAGLCVARAERCGHSSSVSLLYAAFSSSGLQYGPQYRRLVHAWAAGGGWSATARLQARMRRAATQVHPADLDGALQLGTLTSTTASDGELQLPFAVDSALLHEAAGELRAVRDCPCACVCT